ncbi:MAG: SAM-dependent methyltransferase [Nitrospira sp.]|nr:SAM-dependent methyltransferase [Nitrospira sp.]
MFTLDQVVPWGRSFDEYRLMFAMDEVDFSGRILGCGDGPASFNAYATRRSASVVSCDPIYRWSADEIGERIDQTYRLVLEQTRQNQHEFVWDSIQSVEELGRVRMAAMQEFLADFLEGTAEGRYIEAELPSLPFEDAAFDLALCSHLLFLYSAQLGEAFHHAAVMELCRVAREVRIFPLLALGGAPSPFIEGSVRLLRQAGREVVFEQAPCEFQRGGNQMMRVGWRGC